MKSASIKRSWLLLGLCCMLVSLAMITNLQEVEAKTKFGTPFRQDHDSYWWRINKTVEVKETARKEVDGQPKNGTSLKKGDYLYYGESKGTNQSLSVSVGGGYGSVSISVPLGKNSSKSSGHALRIPHKGKWKITGKKQYKLTVYTVQYCKSNKKGKPNGNWKNGRVMSKEKRMLESWPKLKDMKTGKLY